MQQITKYQPGIDQAYILTIYLKPAGSEDSQIKGILKTVSPAKFKAILRDEYGMTLNGYAEYMSKFLD